MVETPAASPKHAAPWRGRKRAADTKTKPVMMRCTPAEHASLQASAAQSGLSVGAFLRAVAFGSAGPRAVRRPPAEREALVQLLGHIGKIGSNVNQLAHGYNTTGELPAWLELRRVQHEVAAIRAALMTALGREP